MEHHSNIIPWQIISKKKGLKLKYFPILEDGNLDILNIKKYFSEKTRLVSVIHQSNVFGIKNSIEKIINYAHKKDIPVLIDGAQSTPHFKVDVSELDCDFFVFSGHKMLGPTGVGVLYAKTHLLEKMSPFLGGGQMINKVSLETSTWNDIPWKFEAGTPKIAQVIGLGAAIDYLTELGMDNINRYINKLQLYAFEKLQKIPNIKIYGDIKGKGAIISFNIKNIHPHDIAHILDSSGIAIRAGHHCAQPLMNKLDVSSTNRVSLYIYNSFAEVDKLIISLNKVVEMFN